jgi:hypothetical protein
MKLSFQTDQLGAFSILAWAIGLLLAFLLYQAANTSSPAGFAALLAAGKSFLAVTLLFTAAAGSGMAISGTLRGNPLLHLFCAPLLGLILVSTGVLFAGLLQFIPNPFIMWMAIGAINLVFIQKIRVWFSILGQVIGILFSGNSQTIHAARVGVLLLIMVALLIALAPPVQWDSLMYHLPAGRFYMEQGGIVTSPDNYRFSNPNLIIMLFMILQITASPAAGALLTWFFGIWTLAGIAVFWSSINTESDKRSQGIWITAVLVFSANSIWIAMTRAYADMALMPFVLAAVMLLLGTESDSSRGRLLLAGALCGAMASIKYTAFPFCISIGLLAFISQGGWTKRGARALLLTAISAAAILLPWLLKNWIVDGNPLAPYLWGSPAFDAYDLAHTNPAPLGSPLLNPVILPLQAAVFGYEYHDPFQGSIGPVLIGLFPAIFLFRKVVKAGTGSTLKKLAITLIPPFLAWTLGASYSQNLAIVRFYLPMFMLMALSIATWSGYLPEDENGMRWKKIVTAGASLSLLIGTLQAGFMLARANPLPVLLGLKDENAHLSEQLGHYHALSHEISSLAEENWDVKVVMLWEPKTFYCQPACIGDDNLNTWQKTFDQNGSARAVLDQWLAEGITHVLINHRGAEFLLKQSFDRIPTLTHYPELLALIPERLTPVLQYDDYGLYALR